MISGKVLKEKTKCFHCGENCEEEHESDGHSFCCFGCKTVYEILQSNDLGKYYALDQNPGSRQPDPQESPYDYLDSPELQKKLLDFSSDTYARVTFKSPAIHCSSCIWLLENLSRLNSGVKRSRVNFTKKLISIEYDPRSTSLSRIAEDLKSIGYKPDISANVESNDTSEHNLIIKLALAGFCFGNIMLLSFPEYLGLTENETFLLNFFPWLNLLLSLPVLFYSGSGYFKSALGSLSQKQISIDVPIALGLSVIFLRSIWDIASGTGSGYLDSLSGLVFFLLVGRWFQNRTYQNLAFDRDFTSYFPLAIRKWIDNSWSSTLIYKLKPGDKIQVRNREIIPADSCLKSDCATINYSFVTGESTPVEVKQGEIVYAGGQSLGLPVELEVEKETSQSQLTDIWNQDIFKKETASYKQLIDRIAKVFTWAVIGISAITAVYWYFNNPVQVWLNVTAVLIVACPCALALATPFTYGTLMRVFGRNQFYLKNAEVGEKLSEINSVVFDKTGTLTHGQNPLVQFHGNLNSDELDQVKALAGLSTHPLSTILATSRTSKHLNYQWDYFNEIPGRGIEGKINEMTIRLGSAEFAGCLQAVSASYSHVFVSINNQFKGYFIIQSSIRKDIDGIFNFFGKKVKAILSGDNESDKKRFEKLVSEETKLLFGQSARDKLDYIKELQNNNQKVMMFGDGLNDAGALKQSNIGIAVTDDTGLFTPSCDAILHGSGMRKFPRFVLMANKARRILFLAFGISFIYNITALTFAVTGNLSPLLAAILMPASSISVVAFCVGSVEWFGQKILAKEE